MGLCLYTAPCVIGAMLTPEQRLAIKDAGYDGEPIGALVEVGVVLAPAEQIEDIERLQIAFDKIEPEDFKDTVRALLAKYADRVPA